MTDTFTFQEMRIALTAFAIWLYWLRSKEVFIVKMDNSLVPQHEINSLIKEYVNT